MQALGRAFISHAEEDLGGGVLALLVDNSEINQVMAVCWRRSTKEILKDRWAKWVAHWWTETQDDFYCLDDLKDQKLWCPQDCSVTRFKSFLIVMHLAWKLPALWLLVSFIKILGCILLWFWVFFISSVFLSSKQLRTLGITYVWAFPVGRRFCSVVSFG